VIPPPKRMPGVSPTHVIKSGDLVRLIRSGEICVVTELSDTAKSMIGVWMENETRWILDFWLEVINENE